MKLVNTPHLEPLWWNQADTLGLNPSAFGHAGSNPARGIFTEQVEK